MKSWKTRDYFEIKDDGKNFPSEGASAYVEFTCKKCGYTFNERCFGTFNIDEKWGYDLAEDRMADHIVKHHIGNNNENK